MVAYDQDYLAHHGIMGMKWGVRRYQNYDGSYTQAGMKRYNKSMSNYEKAKSDYDSSKANGSKGDPLKKRKVKEAKNQLEKDYKHLKLDKMADKGKERYQKGQTITEGNEKIALARKATATAATSAYVARNLGLISDKQFKVIAVSTLAAEGATEVANLIKKKGDKELRAYYSHTSNY